MPLAMAWGVAWALAEGAAQKMITAKKTRGLVVMGSRLPGEFQSPILCR